jgi:pyrroloquinoline-quinone synthase
LHARGALLQFTASPFMSRSEAPVLGNGRILSPKKDRHMPNTQLLDKIDAAIAEKNLLNHPFYQDWQAGKLSRESLQLYAAQYYRHVQAFPQHLRVLAARADDSLKPVVLENLAEEENPEASHPQLWLDFAAALGVSEEYVTSAPSLPGTQHVVHTFRDICANRSIGEAVAALYAYESQVPEIAITKIDGLNRYYGINDAKGTAYFSVHEEADKAHRAAWRNWLIQNAGSNDEQILASTHNALNALWGALDAVHCGSCSKN